MCKVKIKLGRKSSIKTLYTYYFDIAKQSCSQTGLTAIIQKVQLLNVVALTVYSDTFYYFSNPIYFWVELNRLQIITHNSPGII